MHSKPRRLALKICLLYFFIAGAWIIASNRVLSWLSSSGRILGVLETYKGLLFIVATSLLLYLTLTRIFRRMESAGTRLARAEKTVRESRDRLQRVLDGMFAFVGVLTVDGILEEGNRAPFEMAGIRREEAIGKPFAETFWWSHSPETQRQLNECIQKAARGEIVRRDFVVRVGGGRLITIDFALTPLRDEDNRIVGLVASAVDITARKLAEDELRETSEKFHQLADNITDVFWMRSPDFQKVIYISPAFERVWGRPLEELYSNPGKWVEFVYPDDRERVMAAFDELRQTGRSLDAEYRIIWPSGEIRWIRARGFQVRDPAGQIIRYIGIITDVTERRRLEERYRQAQKMEAIGQLAGGVAHDFNNILAVIQMQAGLMQSDPEIPPQQREFARDIVLAAERAGNLTRQLLMVGCRQAVQAREHDLNDIVANIARMLQRILGEQIQMQFKWAMARLWVCVDAGMIDQILMNLAVNARDAMPQGGTLTIQTAVADFDERQAAQYPQARAGSFVCLTVSDTGHGIAPDNLPHIFEPFFTTKEVGRGTGLGLATVFGIVQQHQGWIHVESRVDHGSTFRLYFPRLEKPPVPPPRERVAEAMRRGKETILLVEDDAAVSRSVQNILTHLGYRVFPAANGIDALKVWNQHRDEIQLLLTDLVMPYGIGGRELAARLLEEKPGLKVIYNSGYATDLADETFYLEDGLNFLQKPYSPQRLSETLRRNLEPA